MRLSIHAGDDEEESMDTEMQAVDSTMLEQSVYQPRYSILQQVDPRLVETRGLLDMGLSEAQSLMSRSQGPAQLDCVMSDKTLSGLFGEHLKRQRDDALVRILDELSEFKRIAPHSTTERLSLARAIYQLYLAKQAARENYIALTVVTADTRKTVRQRISDGDCGDDVFAPVENAIKSHLATQEIPKFVACDLYKTVGLKVSECVRVRVCDSY